MVNIFTYGVVITRLNGVDIIKTQVYKYANKLCDPYFIAGLKIYGCDNTSKKD